MYNIAVTGVGGGVGQSILKSLAETDYNLIALDSELLGVGLYASKTAYVIPYANDNNYIVKLLEICKKEKVALLFPGLDAELMILALNTVTFKAIGTTIVVSKPEVIIMADDKLQTYETLITAGVNVPFTTLAKGFNPIEKDFPLILKQKVGGARSKNVFKIKNSLEWQDTLEKIGKFISNYIVMEYIEGNEYTCGTINLDGYCKGVIIMRRILRDGDTHKCFSEKNEVIEKEVRLVVDTIKPFGACNVQLRIKNSIPYVFEINARCSGTTAARTLSGFNEPKMIADYLLKDIEPKFKIKEHTILRYWKELVVENDEIQKMNENNFLSNLEKLVKL
ncbi:ATP-grasp domain-containing protein [Lutibacter sp.]|uniref:ATP-grasp domain-containing protein n=1 Tax=Lutibacter sp. TaxID=1925666 RepID=UPI0027343BDF|nr:ATP-grasp domain-containing protein [Lutibacter sp.]MDP3312572.1 ATP-grasp domain-containing protein [Lutibacter sp.]